MVNCSNEFSLRFLEHYQSEGMSIISFIVWMITASQAESVHILIRSSLPYECLVETFDERSRRGCTAAITFWNIPLEIYLILKRIWGYRCGDRKTKPMGLNEFVPEGLTGNQIPISTAPHVMQVANILAWVCAVMIFVVKLLAWQFHELESMSLILAMN